MWIVNPLFWKIKADESKLGRNFQQNKDITSQYINYSSAKSTQKTMLWKLTEILANWYLTTIKTWLEYYSCGAAHRKVGQNITRIKLPIEKSAEAVLVLNYQSKCWSEHYSCWTTLVELPIQNLVVTILVLNYPSKTWPECYSYVLNKRTKAIMVLLMVEIEYAYSDWCHKDERSTTLLF
jgi:hypothetical protein